METASAFIIEELARIVDLTRHRLAQCRGHVGQFPPDSPEAHAAKEEVDQRELALAANADPGNL